jgi:D-glycero-D-manno-heptose 1,7-bisphosphate phosphatase
VAKPAVFLDLDGVLGIEMQQINEIDNFNSIPDVASAVRHLNDLKLFCCSIANRSGLAKNLYSVSDVDTFYKRLRDLLKKEAGAKVDAIYYCPYLNTKAGGVKPDFTRWSTWNKPNTGMLIAAAWEYDLDLKHSFVIGDKSTDIEFAHNAGAKGILIKTSTRKQISKGNERFYPYPEFVASDLMEAVKWLDRYFKSP